MSPGHSHLNPGQRSYAHGAFSNTASTFSATDNTDATPVLHNTTFQAYHDQLTRSSPHFEV